MKLYTEEQVNKMIELARFTYQSEDKIFSSFTPIELPSDEEIDEAIFPHMELNIKVGFIEGAKWMRDKIQGGNK